MKRTGKTHGSRFWIACQLLFARYTGVRPLLQLDVEITLRHKKGGIQRPFACRVCQFDLLNVRIVMSTVLKPHLKSHKQCRNHFVHL